MRYTSPPVPYAVILGCSLCDVEVHRALPTDTRHPDVIADEAEVAIARHLADRHPLRFWLWRRLRWDWLIRGFA